MTTRFVNLKNMTEEKAVMYPTVLCLGNFDGVHIGHRQLVDEVNHQYELLKDTYAGLKRGAWFFESNSYKGVENILSIDEKLHIFKGLGLDYAMISDFDSIRSISPESFVNDVLRGDCGCVHAICGENFRFGVRASGDSVALLSLMDGNATVVSLLTDYGNIISSTYIRSLLANGEIENANRLLGDNYCVAEEVIHGKALGRTLGIPTINQDIKSKQLLLNNGIYATICTVREKQYFGVTNIGVRPTVEMSDKKNIETYLIDYNDDCYGEIVKVEFVSRIRDEKKFADVESLKRQIFADIERVKNIFK